jgi:O-antigen ligase
MVGIRGPQLPRAGAVPVLAVLGGACLALGYAIPHNALVAGALAAVFLGVVLFTLTGPVRFTSILMAALPWLVLFLDLTPKLTLTLTSAMAVLLLLSVTRPRANVSTLAWIGISLFLVALLAAAIESTTSEQLIEASKYLLFPVMAAIVCSPSGRRRLVGMRRPMLYSGIAAMTAQAATIILHLGQEGTYYGAGEQLGLATEGPHELALIGVIVAVACLVSIRDIRWRLVAASIAAMPALATGVRSALVALVISLLALAIKARFRPSVVLSIAAISAGIIFSGVGTIIVTRYERGQARGEYTSFATTGSGRGALWTVTLHQWQASGARGIVFGSGLRSIERIVEQNLGRANTAQSDLVTVLVELGILGLVAWLLIWLAIVRSGINWLVLLPLASYALTNGSLEYVGAVVFGIALAGACTPASRLSPIPSDEYG